MKCHLLRRRHCAKKINQKCLLSFCQIQIGVQVVSQPKTLATCKFAKTRLLSCHSAKNCCWHKVPYGLIAAMQGRREGPKGCAKGMKAKTEPVLKVAWGFLARCGRRGVR